MMGAVQWEETIGFDERLGAFNKPEHLFMFELLDFVAGNQDDVDEDARKKKNEAGNLVPAQ